MKLWHVRPIDESQPPWNGRPWDMVCGAIVEAESEDAARKLVSQVAGQEGAAVWRDRRLVSCEELKPDGRRQVVMTDFQGPG